MLSVPFSDHPRVTWGDGQSSQKTCLCFYVFLFLSSLFFPPLPPEVMVPGLGKVDVNSEQGAPGPGCDGMFWNPQMSFS